MKQGSKKRGGEEWRGEGKIIVFQVEVIHLPSPPRGFYPGKPKEKQTHSPRFSSPLQEAVVYLLFNDLPGTTLWSLFPQWCATMKTPQVFFIWLFLFFKSGINYQKVRLGFTFVREMKATDSWGAGAFGKW